MSNETTPLIEKVTDLQKPCELLTAKLVSDIKDVDMTDEVSIIKINDCADEIDNSIGLSLTKRYPVDIVNYAHGSVYVPPEFFQ